MANVVVVPSNGSRSLYVGGANKISVWVGQSSVAGGASDLHTKTISQPGHGLTAPSAIYLDADDKFKASIPSDTNKHGFTLLLSTQGDLLTIATVTGIHSISLLTSPSDPNAIVYIGVDGKLTLNEPTIGQNKMIMGWMNGDNQIYYNPVFGYELIAGRL